MDGHGWLTEGRGWMMDGHGWRWEQVGNEGRSVNGPERLQGSYYFPWLSVIQRLCRDDLWDAD
jgi:hypothetical protein